MNIEARIAAMRIGRAAQAQAQAAPLEKKVVVEQAKPEVVAEKAPSSEKTFDIANNTVAKIMDRGDLSDKGKLEAIVEFLHAKDENYNVAQKHFSEFEVYFTYEQSRRTQVSERNIQRLMDELEDGTKSTIEKILRDFAVVNMGAGNIKKLLTVMEKARVDGKTVEVLTEAYRLNEKLLAEISELRALLVTQQREETVGNQTQTRLQATKKQRDESFLNPLLRLFGSEERLDESLYYSNRSLETVKFKIEKFERNLTLKESQRDKKLEDGELTILRSVDATEGGFTNQILQTAKDSLDLIKGTRESIERLLAANAKSRAASRDITTTLSTTTGREVILKGALQVVAKETRLQGETLATTVEKLAAEKAEAAGDDALMTLVTVELDKATQTDKGALDYERILETKVVSFEMLASENVAAEARAQQFATLVESHHELLSNLQQQALPVTANALEMGLQQGVALRDGLLSAGVRDATKQAQAIFGSNLEAATAAQSRLEAENLEQMRAAIAALGQAQILISTRTDKAIEHGLASMDLVKRVTASAEGVRAAMSDFQKVDSALGSHDGSAAPDAPEAPAEAGPAAAA
jgi:hypothetical protein